MGNVSVLTIAWLLLLSMSWEVISAGSDCTIQTNGCSVPLGLKAPYQTILTPACVKHDVCYYCGELYRWNQEQCDKAFKRDMYKLCERNGKRWFIGDLLTKEKRCKSLGADAYYTAVRIAGHLHWEKNSPPWCQKACAKDLGDPNILISH